MLDTKKENTYIANVVLKDTNPAIYYYYVDLKFRDTDGNTHPVKEVNTK